MLIPLRKVYIYRFSTNLPPAIDKTVKHTAQLQSILEKQNILIQILLFEESLAERCTIFLYQLIQK